MFVNTNALTEESTIPVAPSLQDLQLFMQQLLTMSTDSYPAENLKQLDVILLPNSHLSARARFDIYRRSYQARLLSCMREQFPALCYALGKDIFNHFAHDYLQTFPSTSYTLYNLGARFADFLENSRPDRDLPESERESWIDFMLDLARFEREVFVMFDAPGSEGESLANYDSEDIELVLQPCIALGSYAYPVAEYYHAVRRKEAPQYPPAAPSLVILVRKDFLIQTLPLTVLQFHFLNLLRQGMPIPDALGDVAQEAELPLNFLHESWACKDGVRQRWIDAGIFICRRI